MLGYVVDRELHLQAGALEVLSNLLTNLPLQQSHDLLSSSVNDDDDCEHENEATVVHEVFLAAVGVLSQVVVHSPRGSKQILQVKHCIIVAVCFLCVLYPAKPYTCIWSSMMTELLHQRGPTHRRRIKSLLL